MGMPTLLQECNAVWPLLLQTNNLPQSDGMRPCREDDSLLTFLPLIQRTSALSPRSLEDSGL